MLSRCWYWNLKGSIVTQKPSSSVFGKRVAYPLPFDMDNDGKEKIVT